MFIFLVMIVVRVLKIYFSSSECPQSAFQVAVAANQHLIVQDLVNLGAQVNTTDCWGRTPLHVCAEKGHSQVLQVRGSGPGFHRPLSQAWMLEVGCGLPVVISYFEFTYHFLEY